MKALTRIIAALMLVPFSTGLVRAAPPDLDAWSGVYKTRFDNGLVTGESYRSEDILEIVKQTPDSAYIRLHLEFFNGHECNIAGIADRTEDGLVYHGPADYQGALCSLGLTAKDGAIALSDGNGSCRAQTCGARGGYISTNFPLSARRPIKYLPLILKSSEYKDAVAEHAAGAKKP